MSATPRIALALLALLAACREKPGFVIEAAGREGPSTTVRMSGRYWRVDSTPSGRSGTGSSVIVDGEKKVLLLLDAQAKTTTVLDLAALERLMQVAREARKAAAAKMTPEERKLLVPDRIFDAMTVQALEREVRYEKTTRTGSAAGHPCTFHRRTRTEGVPPVVDEVCIAPFAEMGIGDEDLDALRGMNLPLLTGARDAIDVWASSPGVALIVERVLPDGRLLETSRVTSFRREPIPASFFEPPADYIRLKPGQRR